MSVLIAVVLSVFAGHACLSVVVLIGLIRALKEAIVILGGVLAVLKSMNRCEVGMSVISVLIAVKNTITILLSVNVLIGFVTVVMACGDVNKKGGEIKICG